MMKVKQGWTNNCMNNTPNSNKTKRWLDNWPQACKTQITLNSKDSQLLIYKALCNRQFKMSKFWNKTLATSRRSWLIKPKNLSKRRPKQTRLFKNIGKLIKASKSGWYRSNQNKRTQSITMQILKFQILWLLQK